MRASLASAALDTRLASRVDEERLADRWRARPDPALCALACMAVRAAGAYHGVTFEGVERLPRGPALLVGNHGLLGYESPYFFERLRADPRLLAFLVVDMRTGRVALRGNRTEPTAESLRLVSRAAYALPPLMPPVRIGESLLCDGGLLQNAPLERAAALGATEIVYLCNVQVVPHERYDRRWTLPATLRYFEIFFRRASNVGFADAEVTEGTWRNIPFLTIAPPAAPGLRSLLSAVLPTHKRLERLVGIGYAEATAALGQWGRARARVPAQLTAAPP